jgi:hypothetical protein
MTIYLGRQKFCVGTVSLTPIHHVFLINSVLFCGIKGLPAIPFEPHSLAIGPFRLYV